MPHMRRRLFNLAAGMSFVLRLAIVAIYDLNYARWDLFQWVSRSYPQNTGAEKWGICFSRGGMTFSWSRSASISSEGFQPFEFFHWSDKASSYPTMNTSDVSA